MKNQLSVIRFATMQKEYASKRQLVRWPVIRIAVTALTIIISAFTAKAQSRVYVDSSKATAGNGQSWGTAYKTVQEALDAATANSQIKEVFIRKGTYYPSTFQEICGECDVREYVFKLRNNLAIYGGFAGGETDTSQRDITNNPVIWSAERGDPNSTSDNFHRLVVAANCDKTAILDGITITGGHADGTAERQLGTEITNGRYGGGMQLIKSSPTLNNIRFVGNWAEQQGAAVYFTQGSPVFTNCTFEQNDIPGNGIIVNYRGNLTMDNCTFSNNSSSSVGGGDAAAFYSSGIHSFEGSNYITGCLFSGGAARPIITFKSGQATISNCGFVGNSAGAIKSSNCNIGLTNSRIANNTGTVPLWLENGYTSISRCVFEGNNTGGAGCIYNTSPMALSNSLFYNNQAYYTPGINTRAGCIISSRSCNIYNCTFWGNTSDQSGAVYGYASENLGIFNSVFYGNKGSAGNDHIGRTGTIARPIYNCLMQGSYDGGGTGNIFVSNASAFSSPNEVYGADNQLGTSDDGLRLAAISPAINAGNAGYLPTSEPTDLTNAPRVQDGQVDIGCYEGARCSGATILYVDGSVAIDDNGGSWSTPIKSLDKALKIAQTCSDITQIWVKKGTYYPSNYPTGCSGCSSSQDNAFLLKSNLAIYGGFAGNETSLGQRNVAANPTILSGDIGTPDNFNDNCYHVVIVAAANSGAILDGFTIANGHANGSGSITVNGQQIDRAAGAGITLHGAWPTINKCIIRNNVGNNAGGVYAVNSYFTISNTALHNNAASSSISAGGGLYITGSSSGTLVNDVFYANNAATYGGAIYSVATTVTNCTLYGNTAGQGGGIYYLVGNTTVANSILWGNTGGQVAAGSGGSFAASYSCLQGGYSGTGNIGSNPLFANTADADGADNLFATADDGLMLTSASPALNTGSNAAVPNAITADLVGHARIQGGMVAMGAYESVSCNGYTRLYVDAAVAADGTGGSWAQAFKTLQAALNAADLCSSVTEIWVKKGTYFPTAFPAGCVNCGAPRDYTFMLRNNLAIYGGFAGTETSLGQRNLALNKSTLSGDVGTVGLNTDNCATVVMSVANTNAILDGFTVSGANATGLSGTAYFPPYNIGRAGIGVMNEYSAATYLNCTFTGNAGVGMSNNSSTTTINYAAFTSNLAGGLSNSGGAVSVTNSVFYNNSTPDYGSAIYNFNGGNGTITNCTIYGNTSAFGGSIFNSYSSPVIKNCVVWGNNGPDPGIVLEHTAYVPTVSYSLVQGGYTGAGNLDVNPLFVNAADPDGADNSFGTADDGLVIGCLSAALNKGTGAGAPTYDMRNVARPQGSGMDMGAYEQASQPMTPAASISSDAINIQCANFTVNFTANVSGGGTAPVYQWYKNGTAINGANQLIYSTSSLKYGDAISFRITNNEPCATTNYGTSNIITMQVAATTLYVDASIVTPGNGLSWATAYKTLAEALRSAQYCPFVEKVLVAKGTYYPVDYPYDMGSDKTGTPVVTGDNRDRTLHIRAGLELYGGYPTGGGTQNIAANPTILDGSAINGVTGAIAYHTVIIDSASNWAASNDTSRLVGFTIKNGKADGGSSTLSLNGASIRRDFGGGLFVSNATNVLSDNIFTQNNATAGGGLFALSGHNVIRNNVFADNTTVSSGAGFYTRFAETRAYNNIFARNNAGGIGGGTMIDNGVNYITNNTYFANKATENGGALHTENGNGTYRNNIFWGNTVSGSTTSAGADYHKNSVAVNLFTNNLMQLAATSYTNGNNGDYDLGATATANLFAKDPLFANSSNLPGADNYYGTADDGLLPACASPVRDMGSSVGAPLYDIANSSRPNGNGIDAGAYELAHETLPPVISNCPANIVSCNSQTVSWIAPTATDNCGIKSFTSNYLPGATFPVGNTTVIYTATDIVGNTSTCSFTISIPQAIIASNVTGVACVGTNTVFTSNIVNSGNSPQYQWQKNGVDIPGANAPQYSSSALANNDTIRLILTPNTCLQPVTSNSVVVYKFSADGVAYVTQGGAGAKNGSSWANAFDGLQAGLDAAKAYTCITQLWVKTGSYYPKVLATNCVACSTSDSRTWSFSLQNNLAIYGGFAGNETSLQQRDIALNPTILSGNQIAGTEAEPWDIGDFLTRCMHVVISYKNDNTAVLDGFTISDGLGAYRYVGNTPYLYVNDGEVSNDRGFGMYSILSSPTIANCTFVNNLSLDSDDGIRGGGVYSYISSPRFNNCVFRNNRANRGAAIFTEQGANIFEKCSFVGNANGSAVEELFGSTNRYDNCVFFANQATSSVNYSTLTNCTLHEQPSSALFTAPNTIVKNLITDGDVIGGGNISYSITKNALAGVGNSTAIPLFVNTSTYSSGIFYLPVPNDMNGLRLMPCSPGINEGSNAAVSGIATDIQTNNRIFGGKVDMGAYELQSPGRNSLAMNGDEAAQNISGNTLLTTAADCRSIANIQPNGSQPVNGVINAKVWVEQAVPYYKNTPYVARHFNLKPVENASNASARITLYFSQQDFNLFNAENVNDPVYSLPANEGDIAGKSNLRVYQIHGDGDGTGLPGSYSGNAVTINPADEDILWNADQRRWEISFNVTGFSGFFVSVESLIILPLQHISFAGQLSASQQSVNLNWQVSGQTGVQKYVAERAVNNSDFVSIGVVAANGLASGSYTFTDAALPSGTVLLYRIKAVDTDGKFTYSKIISLSPNKKAAVQLYPNPASHEVFLNAAENSLLGTDAILTDVWGRVLQRIKITRWPQKINTASLAAGFYFIKTADENTLRLVIER